MEQIFINVLLVFIEILIVGTVGLSVWSHVRSVKLRDSADKNKNSIPMVKIAAWIAFAIWVVYLITEIFTDSDSININGKLYDDSLWLHISDIVLNTAIVIFTLAALAVCCGYLHTYLLHKTKKIQ